MKKHKSNLAFIDFLFILLLSFISWFMLAMLLVNPISKLSEIENKAEFLIILEWNSDSENDVDLWVQDPLGNILSFRNKSIGLMNIDKDDLGVKNDTIVLAEGTKQIIRMNREVASIRGKVPGEYIINVNLYTKNDENPSYVKVQMIQVNPYKLVLEENVVLNDTGEEITINRIIMDSYGEITSTNKISKSFISSLDERAY